MRTAAVIEIAGGLDVDSSQASAFLETACQKARQLGREC